MSRCKEFYDKCERDGADWCEKCPEAVRLIENYLELTNELEEQGVPKNTTMVGLSERAARPLLAIKDVEKRNKAISRVAGKLKNISLAPEGVKPKKLTTNDVKKIVFESTKPLAADKPMPAEGVYNVILADPPWRYDFAISDSRAIENQYPTLPVEDIKKLSPPSDNDSILFLWATAPMLREALEVMEAWGFEYKTNAVWDKLVIGMGYYFRGQHELLLVGTRGKISHPEQSARPSSVFRAKRGEHSEKPIIVYEIIEKMYPGQRYLELFARQQREGWKSWGNQV